MHAHRRHAMLNLNLGPHKTDRWRAATRCRQHQAFQVARPKTIDPNPSSLCREAEEEEEEEEEELEMSPMCMLTDDMLPLDAASIKRKQARPGLPSVQSATGNIN